MLLDQTTLIRNVRELAGIGDTDVDTLLFSSGALDSVGMLALIAFVEEQAGIEIHAEDVTLDNFDSVGRILRFAGERAG